MGRHEDVMESVKNYLKATKWHSDVYPWRIILAQKKIQEFSNTLPVRRPVAQ